LKIPEGHQVVVAIFIIPFYFVSSTLELVLVPMGFLMSLGAVTHCTTSFAAEWPLIAANDTTTFLHNSENSK